jgi:predicted ATP-grasp superfamily ATP-dependent carboligase
MPQRIYWVQEPHILALEYTGTMTSEDLSASTAQALLEVEKRPLHFLLDLSRAVTTGTVLVKAGNENEPFSELIHHPNSGWFAIVGPNSVARFAIQLLFRQSLVKIFPTRDEAVTFLQALTETSIIEDDTQPVTPKIDTPAGHQPSNEAHSSRKQ